MSGNDRCPECGYEKAEDRFWPSLREMAEDRRYSDEFIGNVVRAHLGRSTEAHDG